MECHRAGQVQLAHFLPLGAGQFEELVEQAGFAQGELAVVGVQVEGAALVARVVTRVAVIDGADAADVSTTTVFKHFSGKEALVFDQDEDRESALIAAVRQRAAGQDILDALRQHVLDTWLPISEHPQIAEFTNLVDSTPALRAYGERMWTRHTDGLSAAIADEFGVDRDDLACVALARFVLEIPVLAHGRPDRRAAVEAIFDILTHGWKPPAPPGVRGQQ